MDNELTINDRHLHAQLFSVVVGEYSYRLPRQALGDDFGEEGDALAFDSAASQGLHIHPKLVSCRPGYQSWVSDITEAQFDLYVEFLANSDWCPVVSTQENVLEAFQLCSVAYELGAEDFVDRIL